MYELIQVSDTCYYIQSPARIGLIRLSDHEVCLIDSGNDMDAGKKLRKILDTHGWTLRAIYNDPAAGRINQNRARRALLTIKKAGRRTAGNEPNLFNNQIKTTNENT